MLKMAKFFCITPTSALTISVILTITTRVRKLLLHRKEIKKLIGKTQEKGLTLVPLKLYFKNGKVKVQLALAKGKKFYDKRHDIAKRESDRELKRMLKQKQRY